MEGSESGFGSYKIMTDPVRIRESQKHTDLDPLHFGKIEFFHKNEYIICQQQAFINICVSSETSKYNL
jgi:hypothetical protein